MRYHFEKPGYYESQYGETYICNHPVYNRCTLFRIGERGLAVIQQRFDPKRKATYWGEIDTWVTDAIYLNPGFRALFESRAARDTDHIFPTMTVRQVMWALKMKPLPKQRWETVFDRREI